MQTGSGNGLGKVWSVFDTFTLECCGKILRAHGAGVRLVAETSLHRGICTEFESILQRTTEHEVQSIVTKPSDR